MKTRCLFVILLFVTAGASFAHAQSGWYPLLTAPKYCYGVQFINADTGFVHSRDSGILRTSDGGMSWQHPLDPPDPADECLFKFIDGKYGFGFGFGIWRTTDAGLTWNKFSPRTAWCWSFPSDSVWYAASAGGSDVGVAKTTNAGLTWTDTVILTVSNDKFRVVDVRGLAFSDKEHGFLTVFVEAQDGSGGGTSAYQTTDGGVTWISSKGGGYQLLYLHDSIWLRVGWNDPGLMVTTDDFKTEVWAGSSRIPPDGNCHPGGYLCKFGPENVCALNTYDGSIFRSTDGGETWYQQLCEVNPRFRAVGRGQITTPTKLVGYAVGIDSFMYKTTDGGGAPFTSGVLTKPCEGETKVFPDPAASVATIELPARVGSELLDIYDDLGRRRASYAIPAGQTSYRLDVRDLVPGVYSLRLTLGNGEVRMTKLVKE